MGHGDSVEAKELSQLGHDLVARIGAFFIEADIRAGDRVKELALVEYLNVSRTPIRSALAYLAADGVLNIRPGGGYTLAETCDQVVTSTSPVSIRQDDELFVKIAQDRNAGRLPGYVSEADMMRTYSSSRATIQRVLHKLSQISIVEKRPGKGWEFLPMIADKSARKESYEYRTILESGVIRHANFAPTSGWINEMRRRHLKFMDSEWDEASSIRLYEMNAAFHLGLAEATKNRFLVGAVQQQNDLRRFINYDWIHGPARAIASCHEHLGILEKIEVGDIEAAVTRLVAHLSEAKSLVRPDL